MSLKNGKTIQCKYCKKSFYLSRSQLMKGRQYCSISCSKKGKPSWNKGLKNSQIAWNKGMPLSKEVKQKLSEKLKGRIAWNKNKKTGLIPKTAFKKGLIPWNKNKKAPYSPETIEKMRQSFLGRPAWNKGIVNCFSESTIEKLRQAWFRRYPNIESHPRWQGGKSFEPYPIEFNKKLKRQILQAFNYQCVTCHRGPAEIALHIHHIDYDKNNNAPDNLIVLCNSCHTKTNTNRNYWENYFSNMKIYNTLSSLSI